MKEIKYIVPQQERQLYDDVCHIIDGARSRIATYVNTEACLTNWYVGKRIKEDVLYNKRAEYGKQVVKNLSVKLTERYGGGWSEKTLRHCLRSAETLYLRYLNQNDRKPWEETPIGLILCSEGNTEHIEYLMLDEESPIKVAQYYTKLPDKKLAELFGTKRPAITKHLKNIYSSEELDECSTCSILEHMGNDGKQAYSTKYYNLDVMISVGYRVNSKNATRLRQWANNVLKQYIIKGYAVNERIRREQINQKN